MEKKSTINMTVLRVVIFSMFRIQFLIACFRNLKNIYIVLSFLFCYKLNFRVVELYLLFIEIMLGVESRRIIENLPPVIGRGNRAVPSPRNSFSTFQFHKGKNSVLFLFFTVTDYLPTQKKLLKWRGKLGLSAPSNKAPPAHLYKFNLKQKLHST